MLQRYHQLRAPCKGFVSHGYVTSGYAAAVARDRADRRWSEAEEPWSRLRWARVSDGRFSTPTAFARQVGLEPHTYAAYERDPDSSKATKLTADRARQFGRELDVRWEWLLWSEGLPWREETDRPAEADEAADLVAAEEDPEERRRMLDVLKAMKRTGTQG